MRRIEVLFSLGLFSPILLSDVSATVPGVKLAILGPKTLGGFLLSGYVGVCM